MYKIKKGGDCDCYTCRTIRQNEQYEKYAKTAFSKLGFIPVIYSLDQYVGSNLQDKIDAHIEMVKELMEGNKQAEIAFKKSKISQKRLSYCFHCGRLHKVASHMMIEQSGVKRFICGECFASTYMKCRDCGAVMIKSKGVAVDRSNARVCASCFRNYVNCAGCGNKFHTSTMKLHNITVDVGNDSTETFPKLLCVKCGASVKNCISCSYPYLQRNMYNGDTCQSCHRIMHHPIHQWSFKPKAIFRLAPHERKREDSLFMGIEWEVENHTGKSHEYHIKQLHTFLPPTAFYCKTDSSIQNGFEVVTQPFTWETWKGDRDAWNAMLAYCRDNKLSSKSPMYGKGWDKTCGIHIHLSKAAFTTTHLYKFMKFFYSKDNRNFILDISGREVNHLTGNRENEYFSFRKQDLNQLPDCAKNKQLASGERHSAVNLMLKNSVEVRIFNSTVETPIFFKNVEFCHAVYYFARDTSMQNLTAEDFLKYISVKPKTYANLHQFIKSVMAGYYGSYLSNVTRK
jgi:hypothetical protein